MVFHSSLLERFIRSCHGPAVCEEFTKLVAFVITLKVVICFELILNWYFVLNYIDRFEGYGQVD